MSAYHNFLFVGLFFHDKVPTQEVAYAVVCLLLTLEQCFSIICVIWIFSFQRMSRGQTLKSNDLPLSFTDLEEVCFLIYNVKKKRYILLTVGLVAMGLMCFYFKMAEVVCLALKCSKTCVKF